MTILCNTTVLSNFATVNQLDCLKFLFQRICIPVAVYEEIQNGIEEGYDFFIGIENQISPLTENGWIQLISVNHEDEIRLLGNLPRHIHSGEAACLVIARQRKWLFLTDDRAARKIAKSWHISLSGTLGCLKLAVDTNQYTLLQANRFLLEMIDHGYRSPITDLSALS